MNLNLPKLNLFNGTFGDNCQQASIPESLKTLVSMILGGPNIASQSSNIVDAQTTLSISQLLLFNSTKQHRSEKYANYHSIDREPPLPIYFGLLIHGETRRHGLVDKLYNLGLSVSYDRVLTLSTQMGNSVIARFEAEGVVCPSKLQKGVFTTAAVDNIDHNPSSSTAKDSFNGTGISMFQHSNGIDLGEERNVVTLESPRPTINHIAALPDSYAKVKPVMMPRFDPVVPQLQGPLLSSCTQMSAAFQTEYEWLSHVENVLLSEPSDDTCTSQI